ncbi:MAG: sigma-70 family RNA polymerase sigma factor [Polyangiales bacterium]
MASELEEELRSHVTSGDIDRATSLAVTSYGPELLGFLRAIAKSDALAADAFAIASEQLWTSLAKFRWEAQLRTWFYQLGRNALHQLRIDPRQRAERNLPLSVITSVQNVRRETTPMHQRTSGKQALRELRESLDPEDHELLILRLDRDMSWKDIARAFGAEDSAIDTRAAALRKRFERVKEQLRELATERGLLPED